MVVPADLVAKYFAQGKLLIEQKQPPFYYFVKKTADIHEKTEHTGVNDDRHKICKSIYLCSLCSFD
jgi:hypothetical protein